MNIGTFHAIIELKHFLLYQYRIKILQSPPQPLTMSIPSGNLEDFLPFLPSNSCCRAGGAWLIVNVWPDSRNLSVENVKKSLRFPLGPACVEMSAAADLLRTEINVWPFSGSTQSPPVAIPLERAITLTIIFTQKLYSVIRNKFHLKRRQI